MSVLDEINQRPHERHAGTSADANSRGPSADLGFDLPASATPSRTRLFAFAAVAVAAIGAAFALSFLPRQRAQHALVANTRNAETALPRVQVVAPKVVSSDRAMSLPGSVQPLEEIVVYSRASGYVHAWRADMGDRVKAGDVLVDIDTPELDQQIVQANAQLVQAQAGLALAAANRAYSTTTLARYQSLVPKGVASQQELDQHAAQSAVDRANVQVAEAAITAQASNVRRLREMKSFARVTAPFDATVNARTTERGALVSPTTPLFKISVIDPVRVFVQVPQDVASSVRVGVPARVMVREFGGRVFEGRVSRSAGALDPASRTMNTEVRVPNPQGELLAGMFVQVLLTLPSPHRVLDLPATALINDAKGLRVATVQADGKIHLAPVTVERDTGATLEIASGIDEADRVVRVAGAVFDEGMRVEVVP